MSKIGQDLKFDLEVLLNDVEVACYADMLARSIQERDDLEAEKKSVSKDFSSKLAAADCQINILAEKVKTKKEIREVACFWELQTNGQTKSLIRTDTHEVVRTEVANDADRQEALFEK